MLNPGSPSVSTRVQNAPNRLSGVQCAAGRELDDVLLPDRMSTHDTYQYMSCCTLLVVDRRNVHYVVLQFVIRDEAGSWCETGPSDIDTGSRNVDGGLEGGG